MIHASLFSGIGGPEIAAAMLGWQSAFHCEINDFGRKILEYWFPKSESYKDVKTTNFTKWRGQIDVLTGGFPCQPFSYAGQRRGADDDRYLWPEFKRVISEIRPTWVVGENVAGITTMVEQGKVTTMESQASLFDEGGRVYRYKYEQPFTIQRVCADLEALQYSVQPFIIPACAVGAPHRRDRVFIVARQVTADTPDTRDESMRQERQDAIHQPQLSADTSGKYGKRPRPEQSDVSRQEQIESRRRSCQDGSGRTSFDTCHAGLQEAKPEQPTAGHRGFGVRTGEWVESFGRGEEIGSRWANFPSVSPIHRGNDGLPFDVDDLAIPFTKWRTESLKAYGNAIVPQVMYEIFRFIEQIEND